MLLAGFLVPPGAPTPPAFAEATQLISTSDPIRAVIKTVTSADVRYTWRAGCPVGPASLRKVEMDYRRYDGSIKRGVLIVRASHASAVAAIFRDAYRNGFRINRMDNPNLWYGNDETMMAADNTSAFNCRRVTGNSSRLSPHSYGKAIDVNPRRNPYKAANGVWYPPNGYRCDQPFPPRPRHAVPLVRDDQEHHQPWWDLGWVLALPRLPALRAALSPV